MTLGPVRVMGAGVVMMMCVYKVMSQQSNCTYISMNQKRDAMIHKWINNSAKWFKA